MYGPRAILIFAAALLLGCRGQNAAYDPFGRTTIPPPATGAVAAPAYAPPLTTAPPAVSIPNTPAAPQFAPGTVPMLQAPPTAAAAPPAAAPAPNTVPGLIPPPGSPPPATLPASAPKVPAGSRLTNPSPPWNGTSGWNPPAANQVALVSPMGSPIVPTAQPTPSSPFGTTAVAPARLSPMPKFVSAPVVAPAPAPIALTAPLTMPPASQVVVIDNGANGQPVVRVEDATRAALLQPAPGPAPTPVATAAPLPSAGRWRAGDASAAATAATATPVALASHREASILVPAGSTRPSVTPTAVTPIATTSGDYESRYGHAADYTRLKGKLEYSATRKQWKLRYIPVDAAGQTDPYGGSVVLAGVSDMSQFRDGEFVAVEGAIASRTDETKDFAAPYNVRQILRVQ